MTVQDVEHRFLTVGAHQNGAEGTPLFLTGMSTNVSPSTTYFVFFVEYILEGQEIVFKTVFCDIFIFVCGENYI